MKPPTHKDCTDGHLVDEFHAKRKAEELYAKSFERVVNNSARPKTEQCPKCSTGRRRIGADMCWNCFQRMKAETRTSKRVHHPKRHKSKGDYLPAPTVGNPDLSPSELNDQAMRQGWISKADLERLKAHVRKTSGSAELVESFLMSAGVEVKP